MPGRLVDQTSIGFARDESGRREVWVAAVQSRQRRNLQWAHACLHAPSSSTGKQSQGPRGGGRGHLIARGPICYVLRARIPDSYRGVCIVVERPSSRLTD